MGSPVRPLTVPDLLEGAGDYIGRGLMGAARPILQQTPFGQFMDPEPVTAPTPATPAAPPVGSPTWAQRFPQSMPAPAPPSVAAPQVEAPEPTRNASGDTLRGIGDRAYNFTADPWNPSGGARSYAQLVSDTNAHALIDAAYEPIIARNNRDAARIDPMTLANEARAKSIEYERMMPAGSHATIRSSHEPMVPDMPADYSGDTPLFDAPQIYDTYDVPPGVTQGQMSDFERAIQIEATKHRDPKAMLDVRSAAARQAELEHIQNQRQQMLEARLPPAEFDARMKKLILDAAQRGAILDGDVRGLAALLYPRTDGMASLTE